MVEEDTVLDAEVAAERLKVERWKENAITCYVNQGLMKLEEGEVLMHDV
jgi:phage FluMu protein gp41